MATSRLASNAAFHAGRAQRAFLAQSVVAARSALGLTIDAARENARLASYSAPSIVLTASDAGDGTATIHVAEHDRVYPVFGNFEVPTVVVAAHDILGVALASAAIYVYYIDPTLADTTPAFLTTDDPVLATNGSAAGLHFVGVVATPAAGGAATTGTGGSAPSGWPPDEKFHNRFDV